MSPVCGECAHMEILEALLESCLSKNRRRRALRSSTGRDKGGVESIIS